MPKLGFMQGLAALFLVILAGVFFWQHPGAAGDRLKPAEIDRYIAAADKLPMPAEEKADSMKRLRAWAEADDGRPVYMLNLMRFYPQVKSLPGGPAPAMTPKDSNAYYEKKTLPMALKMGVTAPFMGVAQGPDVLSYEPAGDHWSRALIIRYPNRRAFLSLVADPAYPAIVPYKLASLQLILAPFNAEMIMPDLTLAAATLLLIAFLGLGWWRAERRCAAQR
jgi:hypothetical protein